QRRDQVGERLASAGPRLDQQALVAVDRVGDPFRHRELSRTRLVTREQRRRGAAGPEQRTDALPGRLAAIGGRVVRRRGHFPRLAFSSIPEMPKRRRSSANTASTETPAASRPTSVWKIRSAASCAVWAASFSFSASVSSPDSSAIFALILGRPASSSDTTYDFSGRSRRRLAITSATRATTSAGGSAGPSSATSAPASSWPTRR